MAQDLRIKKLNNSILHVNVHITKQFRIRLYMFLILVRFAMWIMGGKTNINIQYSDDKKGE